MNDPDPSSDERRRGWKEAGSAGCRKEKPLKTGEKRGDWSCGQFACAGMAMILCGLCGFFLGPLGAGIAGLKPVSSGSFNLEPLLYMFIGMVSGVILFLIMVFLVLHQGDPTERIVKAILCAVIGSFLSGLVGYRIAEFDGARNRERDRERTREEVERYKDYHQQLKKDPGIVLAEKWYLYSSGPDGFVRWKAYRDSLENRHVPYTPDLLSRLLDVEKDPVCLRLILHHLQFDPQRLELEYRLALGAAEDSEVAGRRLITILSGPQAKKEWFEELAASGVGNDGTILWKLRLREMIDNRRTEE